MVIVSNLECIIIIFLIKKLPEESINILRVGIEIEWIF